MNSPISLLPLDARSGASESETFTRGDDTLGAAQVTIEVREVAPEASLAVLLVGRSEDGEAWRPLALSPEMKIPGTATLKIAPDMRMIPGPFGVFAQTTLPKQLRARYAITGGADARVTFAVSAAVI